MYIKRLGAIYIINIFCRVVGFWICRIHITRVFRVVRKPGRLFCGITRPNVFNLRFAVYREYLVPVAIRRVFRIGSFNHSVANKVERGFGHIVCKAGNVALLPQVEHNFLTLFRALRIFECGRNITIKQGFCINGANIA